MITNIDNGMSRTIAREVTDNSRTMAIELEFFAPYDKAEEIRNRLAQVDPLYRLKQLQNANWAQRNNKPTSVLARMNQADYKWRKQRDYNRPQSQLELFN